MPLKIALLTYSTKPRGSVIHALELAQALSNLGHAPCVFALDKDGQGFHRQVNFTTVAVPAKPCEDGIDKLIHQRIEEFVQFFEHHKTHYDIYHAQDCLSANALAQLKASGRLSHFVRTVHHIEDFNSPYLQDCQNKSIYQPDRCLCVSETWQAALKTDYGINAYRVTNGVSDRFSPTHSQADTEIAKAYDIQGNPIYLTVGGIEPRKNSINLLKAFYQVQQQKPKAKLVIVGGATLFDYQDYRKDFMTLAKACDLESALILPGVVPDDDLPALYRLADAFVFPSVQEGWGLVVLEAIASKLPILTSNHPPFTEFLSQESACLVNPLDVSAIAQAMLRIVEPSTAQKLVAKAYPIAQQYSWETSAKKHLSLYHPLAQTLK